MRRFFEASNNNYRLIDLREDSTTMFQDDGGTTPVVSDGNAIGNWKNLGSSAFADAIQATAGTRPLYRVPTAVDFVSSDLLTIAHHGTLTVAGKITISAVINADAFPGRIINKCATNGGTHNPYDFGVLTGGIPYIVRADATGGATHGLVLRPQNYGGLSTGVKQRVTVVDGVGAWRNIRSYSGAGIRGAWQGVATNGTNIYLITDRTDPIGTLHNNLSEFDMSGNFIRTLSDVWSEGAGTTYLTFVDGHYHTDGDLYIVVGNYHTNSNNETIAKVIRLNGTTFAEVSQWSVAAGGSGSSIEGIAFRSNEWWLSYSGTNVIKRYNSSFVFQANHTLPVHPSANNSPPNASWYQGLVWDGDTLYGNLHGGQGGSFFSSPGLDVFTYSGGTFTRQGRIKPPTNGASQGIARIGTTWYWADRWTDELVICDFAGHGRGSILTGATTFYLNGTVVGYDSNWLLNPVITTGQAVRIGGREDATSPFDGKMYSLFLTNKALNADQVAALPL